MHRFAAFLFLTLAGIPAWSQNLTRYAVVLKDPPASAQASRRDTVAMAGARRGIQLAHEAVKTQLRSRNIQITGEAHIFLNAIFVSADAAEIEQLKSMTGVSYVTKMPRYHLELDAAEQLINVPAAWSLLGGTTNAGAGIKIGVIDTGIDLSHAAFQDSSLTPPAGFPKFDPGNQAFTNNKIIVARSYVSLVGAGSGSSPSADSRPDDFSSRDHVGHGTAVAMAAAGNTNTGGSGTITGVAPKAFLGSYKVFGSPGVNDFTTGDAIISAIEGAYNDGMDIVILSLGGPAVYGPLDTGAACGLTGSQPCDAIASVVESAVKGGMVVVAAAGNEGTLGKIQPSLGTISSPGDAPSAIAVGATTNSHSWSNGIAVNGLGSFRSQTGNPAANPVTAPLSDAAAAGDALACASLPANSLTGTIALVQRGTCTFALKVQNLQAAGATGAVITNAVGDNSLLTPGGLGGSGTITGTFIGYDDGQTIRNYLKSTPKASVTILPNLTSFANPGLNQMAGFSSRGPALGTAGIKPDVVAAGTDLYLAAQSYDPNGALYSAKGYVVSQGTSFSAPQVAGLAALVMQAHPGLTTAQVKSAIVNTATQDILENGAQASVISVGAGKAQAAAAVTTNLFLSPSTLSFGIIKSTSLPAARQLLFTNTGSTPLNLTIGIIRRTAESNAHISIDQPNLAVPAGQTVTLNATLSGSLPVAGSYEGYITVAGAANLMQIPFLYLVGDAVPYNIISIAGDGDNGLVNQQNSEGGILLQVLDRFGLPVPRLPVRFSVTLGGGKLVNSDSATDSYGFAGSNDSLGPVPGSNVFTGTAGTLSTSFNINSSLQAVVLPGGAVNAANFQKGQAVAPGSYISLFGNNLATATQVYATPNLPLSIAQVSVSFDSLSITAPGRLWFVSPGQVNVFVPWEMQDALKLGQTAAQIKVTAGGNSGAVYNLPLASYSPAFFESPSGFAAALDQNNVVVTNTNAVAQGSVLQLFLNGLGPVTNRPASGDQSPLRPLAETIEKPVVTIGGLNAPVQFSGMTPGQVGLYQINVQVPNTGAGVKPLQVSIGGVSSTVSSIAVR